MDIEGLGEKNVELLYSNGLIKHFEDIYKLKKEDLLELPRFAKKISAESYRGNRKIKTCHSGKISLLQ